MNRETDDPFAMIEELFRKLAMGAAGTPGQFSFRTVVLGGFSGGDGATWWPVEGAMGPRSWEDTDGTIREEFSPDDRVEVHQSGDDVLLVTELPGFSVDQVEAVFDHGTCAIEATDGDRHCRKTVTAPAPEPSTIRKTLRHGVFELGYSIVRAEAVDA